MKAMADALIYICFFTCFLGGCIVAKYFDDKSAIRKYEIKKMELQFQMYKQEYGNTQ